MIVHSTYIQSCKIPTREHTAVNYNFTVVRSICRRAHHIGSILNAGCCQVLAALGAVSMLLHASTPSNVHTLDCAAKLRRSTRSMMGPANSSFFLVVGHVEMNLGAIY